MKEVVFIVHQKGTQGSYLNHLDLQQYLKDIEGNKISTTKEELKEKMQIYNERPWDYEI